MEKKYLIVTTIQNTMDFFIDHIKKMELDGYEVHLATKIYKDLPSELKNNKWNNISFSRNPFAINYLKVQKEIRNLLAKEKFDIVHFHTPIASFLGRYAAMKEKQKNIIYTAHGFHFYKGAPLLNWLLYYLMEVLASRWTDKIITINEEDYRIAIKKLSKKAKIYKIDGVGLDLDKYKNGNRDLIKKELKIMDDEVVITMIGELNINKNQIQLLKAVSMLKDSGVNSVRVILVGVGNQEKILKEEIELKGIKADLLGYRKDIKDIIAASDIICSMSYREGLPRNLMEAMAQGKPLIATNIRGNRDIVKNDKNGFLVEVNNIEETAEAIKKLVTNKNLVSKIQKNNLEDVEKYSIKKILSDMENIYEEKIGNS